MQDLDLLGRSLERSQSFLVEGALAKKPWADARLTRPSRGAIAPVKTEVVRGPTSRWHHVRAPKADFPDVRNNVVTTVCAVGCTALAPRVRVHCDCGTRVQARARRIAAPPESRASTNITATAQESASLGTVSSAAHIISHMYLYRQTTVSSVTGTGTVAYCRSTLPYIVQLVLYRYQAQQAGGRDAARARTRAASSARGLGARAVAKHASARRACRGRRRQHITGMQTFSCVHS